MRYFIGYTLIGKEKKEVDDLRHEISERFHTKGALRLPPHITLVPPFETPDHDKLIRALEHVANKLSPIDVTTPKFNFFRQHVWFIDVPSTPELLALRR